MPLKPSLLKKALLMVYGIHTILTYHCCFMDGMLMPEEDSYAKILSSLDIYKVKSELVNYLEKDERVMAAIDCTDEA